MTACWLVTGGAGFIGSHLVDHLLRRGDRVVVLDNFSTGSDRNLPSGPARTRLTLVQGDVACADLLASAVAGSSGVFHCAATVGIQDCIDNWVGAHATNATASIRVFDAALRAGGLPVVYASSAAVYGDRSGELCQETLPERPVSPYGADKLACEHHARAFWQVHGLPTAGLRLFNVYGPRQAMTSAYSGVLARFAGNGLEGTPNVVYGDGLQSRDFVHVRDVVAGMIAAMDRLSQGAQCLVSNICTGRAVSVLDLLALVEKHTGNRAGATEFGPKRAGEIRHSRGSTARMAALLGLHRTVPLEDGVRDYLSLLEAQRTTLAPMIAAGG